MDVSAQTSAALRIAKVFSKYRLSDDQRFFMGYNAMAAQLAPHFKISGMTLLRWAYGISEPSEEKKQELRTLAAHPDGGKWSAWANDMLAALEVEHEG